MPSRARPVDGREETIPPASDRRAVDAEILRARHVDLIEQHHDLDDVICALSALSACDELLVARLKKRKLRVKDEIARIAGGLAMADIAASGRAC